MIIIIPDLHGHYNEFISLLSKFVIIEDNKIILKENQKIILLGDLIDKGPLEEQKKLIEFIYENLESFYVIKGNHDLNTFKILNKEINHLDEKHDFFHQVLKEDPELEIKFLKIFENSNLYYEDDFIFCNHSPCLKKHVLNKDNNLIKFSFKTENYFPNLIDYENYLRNHFSSILEEQIDKFHIFGHIGLSKPLFCKNQIWLDTAELSSLNFLIFENKDFYIINNNFIINDVFSANSSEEAIDLIINEWKKLNDKI